MFKQVSPNENPYELYEVLKIELNSEYCCMLKIDLVLMKDLISKN